MYIAPGQGQTAPGDKSLMSTEILSIYPFVASFKEISLKSDFIHFFHDLIHVYSSGAGGIQPPGDNNFDDNRNFLSLRSSVASFKSQTTTVSEKSIVLLFSRTKA